MSGRFGDFGGRFVPETLMPALEKLESGYRDAIADPAFQRHLDTLLRDWVGRPTPLTDATRLTAHAAGARILLKREDLAHTGAHKINNALGQALLAQRLGCRRIIAETGAGQHGVATATVCALLGLECVVYMGEEDVGRQAPNVQRMQLLGAQVIPVRDGSRTLKDAVNAALRDWVANVADTYYLIGSAVGPHPYPTIVRDFQRIIGIEVADQHPGMTGTPGSAPDAIIASVGGGSNAIGIFHPFIDNKDVRLFGAEAGGSGIDTGLHAAAIAGGTPGVLHGAATFLMQDDDGQVVEPHSISAGLDYPGVGPEHAHLASTGRATYVPITDDETLDAFSLTCRLEGIVPALESAHAIALALRIAADMSTDESIVVCLSGRGDKDLDIVLSVRPGLTP